MSTMTELQSGIRYQAQFTVQPKHTVPAVDPDWPGFADMPPVLATAMMIGFMGSSAIYAAVDGEIKRCCGQGLVWPFSSCA